MLGSPQDTTRAANRSAPPGYWERKAPILEAPPSGGWELLLLPRRASLGRGWGRICGWGGCYLACTAPAGTPRAPRDPGRCADSCWHRWGHAPCPGPHTSPLRKGERRRPGGGSFPGVTWACCKLPTQLLNSWLSDLLPQDSLSTLHHEPRIRNRGSVSGPLNQGSSPLPPQA